MSDSEKPDAPDDLGPGTDITAEDQDLDADDDTPATSDPEAFTDDPDLGGTHGGSSGGAG